MRWSSRRPAIKRCPRRIRTAFNELRDTKTKSSIGPHRSKCPCPPSMALDHKRRNIRPFPMSAAEREIGCNVFRIGVLRGLSMPMGRSIVKPRSRINCRKSREGCLVADARSAPIRRESVRRLVPPSLRRTPAPRAASSSHESGPPT